MASEKAEIVKQAFAAWQAASAAIAATPALPDTPAAPSGQTLWALRALLHPALRPFLRDPTQTINGQFPSLDSHAGALLETPGGQAAVPFLGSDDHAALYQAGFLSHLPDRWDAMPSAAQTDSPAFAPDAAEIGAIWGSLYLPALQKASPCRIKAVWSNAPANAAHWPDPQTLRPASPDIQATGKIALSAALAVLRQSERGTPAHLRPGLLVWDVCLPGLPDALLENAQGQSLQLPLALAFLSLFTQSPLPTGWAATGALGDANGTVDVRAVGFVREKAQALLFLGPNRVFWTPPKSQAAEPAAFTVPVRFLTEAAAQAGETLADSVRAAPPQTCARTNDTAEKAVSTAKAIVCIYIEDADDSPTPFAVAHQTLARFAPLFRNKEGEGIYGESLYAAFSAQADTLSAVLAVRRELRCFLPWPPLPAPSATALLPRIGVAFSPEGAGQENAVLAERAFSLARSTCPAQILVDASDAGLGRSSGFRVAPLGWFRLLHLGPPVLLHALCDAEPASDEENAPENTLQAVRHNLPVEPLPLVGRKKELARLAALLEGKTPARLVTLSGVGGVGKTRLALEAAARAGAFFRGGIWFVPVGSGHEDDLAALLADTLQIILVPHEPTASSVAPTFAQQVVHRINQSVLPVCIVLDNAEAAPDAVASLAARLTDGGKVFCVVTSHRPLGLPDEVVFPVGPLTCPPFSAADTSVIQVKRDVLDSSAGAFFLSRVAHPPQNEGWKTVVQLCRTLCGVPLALELIAAQTPFLSYAEIARRLIHFLPDGSLTQTQTLPPPPHLLRQTLRLVYELLSHDEKTLLRRVSVLALFSGGSGNGDGDGGGNASGWTQNAALAVSGLEAEAARDALDGLEARRLIRGRGANRARRYDCLPLIAEWASGLLFQNTNESHAACRAHAAYFVQRASDTYLKWDTPDETGAIDGLYAERNQLLAAAAYLHQTDPIALVSFVADLAHLFLYRGMTQAWREWPRKAVRILEMEERFHNDPNFPNAVVQAQLYRCCALACLHTDTPSAHLYLQSGLRIARDANHRRDIADLLNVRGLVHQKEGDGEKADADWDEARALYEVVGNKRGLVTVLNNQGLLRGSQNDWRAAQACHEKASQLCLLIQDKRGLCYALGNLGCDAFYLGDALAAQTHFGEQLGVARQLKDAQSIGAALVNLGDVLDQMCHDPAPAIPLLVLGEQIFAKLLHPLEKEAASYLARIAENGYGTDQIALLRHDFSRRSLSYLITLPLMPPRRLTLPD